MNLETENKNKSRGLTRFICQELLYEFVTGRLDPERQKEVDTFLTGDRESQREFERLKRGLRYASQCSRTQVSDELRESLDGFEPHWKKVLSGWTLWSSRRGWKALPYVFLVSALVLSFVVFKPWRYLAQTDVMLAEQMKAEPERAAPTGDVVVQPATPVTPLIEKKDDSVEPPAFKQKNIPDVAAATAVEVGSPVKADEGTGEIEVAPVLAPEKRSSLRGTLEIEEFDSTWPLIRDKISELEGVATKNTQLGRSRKPDEALFDFTLPESKQGELEEFLNTFGPVRFSKDRRSQVMPEGQIRIILTVKDGTTHEGPAETP